MRKVLIIIPIILPLIVFTLTIIQYSNDDVYHISKSINPEEELLLEYGSSDKQYIVRNWNSYGPNRIFSNISQVSKMPTQIGTTYNALYKMQFSGDELDFTFQERVNEYPNYNYNLNFEGEPLFDSTDEFFTIDTKYKYNIVYVGEYLYYYNYNDSNHIYLISANKPVEQIDINQKIDGYDYTYKYVFADYFDDMIFTDDYIFELNDEAYITNLKTGEEKTIISSEDIEVRDFMYYYDYDDNILLIVYNEVGDYDEYVYIYDLNTNDHIIKDSPGYSYYTLLNYEGSIDEQ